MSQPKYPGWTTRVAVPESWYDGLSELMGWTQEEFIAWRAQRDAEMDAEEEREIADIRSVLEIGLHSGNPIQYEFAQRKLDELQALERRAR